MAKYQGSIYGSISGQQLGSVGSRWKGIDYIRQYVIPNNPKTAAQTLQRTIFSNVCGFLRKLVSSVLNPYWLPAPKKMSAFNAAMALNVPLQEGAVFNPMLIKVTQGSLYNPGFAVAPTKQPTMLQISWNTNLVGDALATDVFHAAVYDTLADTFRYATAARSVGTIEILNADLGTVAEGDPVFLFAVNALGTVVSDSVVAAIVGPA